MEVRIGVVESHKELSVEMDGTSLDGLIATVEDALSGKSPVLWLTDDAGRRVGVASARIAYVEVVTENQPHQVGFGAT